MNVRLNLFWHLSDLESHVALVLQIGKLNKTYVAHFVSCLTEAALFFLFCYFSTWTAYRLAHSCPHVLYIEKQI